MWLAFANLAWQDAMKRFRTLWPNKVIAVVKLADFSQETKAMDDATKYGTRDLWVKKGEKYNIASKKKTDKIQESFEKARKELGVFGLKNAG